MKKIKKQFNLVLDKLDGLLFAHVEKVLVAKVKKSKYKQHKYQILKEFRKLNFAVFIFVIFGLSNFLMINNTENFVVMSTFQTLVWLPMLFILIFTLKRKDTRYDNYSFAFELRKNPEVYKIVKDYCGVMRVLQKEVRDKLIIAKLFFMFVLIMPMLIVTLLHNNMSSFVVVCWLFLDTYVYVLDDYIDGVFDFDAPDKQEKKVKDSVTDIVRKQLDHLIEVMKPSAFPVQFYKINN